MDQQSTGYQQENKLLTMIVDILLELFPDPYKDFKVLEELEIQDGVHIGMKLVPQLESHWLDKLSEMLELLPHDASSLQSLKFPYENFKRFDIFNCIYAKLQQTVLMGRSECQPQAPDIQDHYRKFLKRTKVILKSFDFGRLSVINLIVWTQITMNIDPKGEVQTKCDDKLESYVNTSFFDHYDNTQVRQQIMDQLQQIVGQINNSPVLEQIYIEFSKQLGIPCGQQLSYAFKFCKLFVIYDQMIHGLILMDGTIILNLIVITNFTEQQIQDKKQMDTLTAYYLIVLLQQSAQFFLRKSLNTYDISTWEKAKRDDPNSHYTESGLMLENILMPPISQDSMKGILNVNQSMAEFLLDENNWKLPLNEFQNKLQVLSQTTEVTFSLELKAPQKKQRPILKFQSDYLQFD